MPFSWDQARNARLRPRDTSVSGKRLRPLRLEEIWLVALFWFWLHCPHPHLGICYHLSYRSIFFKLKKQSDMPPSFVPNHHNHHYHQDHTAVVLNSTFTSTVTFEPTSR